MKVGYCVPHAPHMASYRLRVALPAPMLGCDYEIGCTGSPTFFYKHYEGDIELAKSCGPYVYDVVNDHFAGKLGEHYRTMCGAASRITCASPTMGEIIRKWTGREATVIDDPYENEEWLPQCQGNEVLWLGHAANIESLFSVVGELANLRILLTVCTNYKHPSALEWSPEIERRSLARCGGDAGDGQQSRRVGEPDREGAAGGAVCGHAGRGAGVGRVQALYLDGRCAGRHRVGIQQS